MPQPVPRHPTPFFERPRSRARIGALLQEHRLVTLTGVGGSGKTRLALRMAEEAVVGGGEVGWVELAPLTDPQLVAATTCTSLGLPVGAEEAPMEALVRHLTTFSGLLVLDNCEHVRAASRSLIVELLDGCPGLRILATSREPLQAPAEVVWQIPTLSVPGMEDATDVVRRVSEAGSARFFVQRTRAARPDFELTPENAAAVGHLCRLLDGIPLALELAAARIRVLTPDQIVQHLEDGLALLSRTDEGGPDRHRTMTAALEWSYRLLGEPQRGLLRRLAAFRGGASLDACRRVCAGGAVGEAGILDLLGHLVASSLVVVVETGDVARYRLLEPVRLFALERLDASGERQEVEDRHASCLIDLAETWARGLRTTDRPSTLARFETELGNLRRAWDHSVEVRAWSALTRLAQSLFWFWHFGGHFMEGRRRSEQALGAMPSGSPDRCDLLWASGALAWMQGDHDTARMRLEECVMESRVRGREELLPLALRELAGVRLASGRLEEARDLYEEASTLLDGAGRPWDRALTLVMLADTCDALGDSATAGRAREEASGGFERVGDPWGLSLTRFGVAVASARDGDLTSARGEAHEALALQRSGAGDEWNLGQILALLGEIEARSGDLDRAADHLIESLEAFREVADRASLSHGLMVLAAAEAGRGRTLRAVRLAGAGDALARGGEARYPYGISTVDDHRALVDDLRRTAGEEAFAVEWAAGRSMPVEDAVAFAFDAPRRGGRSVPADARAGSARLRIFGLGRPEVLRGRQRLRTADWSYALPREMLFYLMLHGPRTKEQIGLDFWPEATRDQLRGRFRTALYHLRRALGGTEWVRYEDGRYAFDRDLGHWFDVHAFERALDGAERRAGAHPRESKALLRQAIDLYRGDLLEGESPRPWVSVPRDRLRRRYREALLQLAELRSEDDADEAAVPLYRRALELDEFDERAHRELAGCLVRIGDRTGALRQLDELEDLLRSELDAAPSPETVELRARVARSRPT